MNCDEQPAPPQPQPQPAQLKPVDLGADKFGKRPSLAEIIPDWPTLQAVKKNKVPLNVFDLPGPLLPVP